MKIKKRKRIRALFEHADITIGNARIVSGGSHFNTEIFIDGKRQLNVQLLKFVIDARKDDPVKLYLEVIPEFSEKDNL